MHKRQLAPRPRAPHPMEAIILQSGLPFANREPLRGMLRQLIDPGAFQQILQLSGEAATGKRWTYYLIDYFCAREHSHIPCYYSVPEDAGLTGGPCEVAKDLVTQLGGNALQAPEQTDNLDAYTNKLAHWVLSVANGIDGMLNARVWFVLDGFSATALRPDTAKFLSTLARLCTTGLGARRHRAVFCQFEHALPSTLQMRVAKYRTEPITRDVIRAQASLRQDLAPDEVDAVAETLTTRVIGDLPEPFEDLTEIGANLIEALTGAQSYD